MGKARSENLLSPALSSGFARRRGRCEHQAVAERFINHLACIPLRTFCPSAAGHPRPQKFPLPAAKRGERVRERGFSAENLLSPALSSGFARKREHQAVAECFINHLACIPLGTFCPSAAGHPRPQKFPLPAAKRGERVRERGFSAKHLLSPALSSGFAGKRGRCEHHASVKGSIDSGFVCR